MYRVGVIGLGSIAAMYGKPDQKEPYCHVGGILHSKTVRLAAVADLSEEAQARFRSVWGNAFPELNYYKSSGEMLQAEKLDIVAVCVRGPHHYQVMMEVLEAGPQAIFLEKPPSCSLVEMDEMVEMAAQKNIPVTVSYSRHWAPHILRMQELVEDGLIGTVRKVVGYTGGSILSFGIHTTDLICQFAGYNPQAVFATGKVSGDAPAGYEPEPALDTMVIEFPQGVTGVQIGEDGEFGGFYCEVYGTEGSIRAGMYIPPFARNSKREPIDLRQYGMPPRASVFTVAYNEIAGYLGGEGPLPACTNDRFVAVNEIGFAAIESIHRKERVTLPNQHRTRKVYANG